MLARGSEERVGRGLRVVPAVVVLLLSTNTAADEAAGPPPPELQLFWSDHYGLLQKKLPVWGRDSLPKQIEEPVHAIGVGVRWLDELPDSQRSSEPLVLVVRIVLVPLSGEGWRLPANAMGAVMDKRLLTRSLYIFFPTVLQTIGEGTATRTMLRDPRRVRQLARALARVVTHEVLHAVDPELPHERSEGIMSSHLTPEMLRREGLGFTSRTATRLVATIASALNGTSETEIGAALRAGRGR